MGATIGKTLLKEGEERRELSTGSTENISVWRWPKQRARVYLSSTPNVSPGSHTIAHFHAVTDTMVAALIYTTKDISRSETFSLAGVQKEPSALS